MTGAEPPEITSGIIYAGPGPASLQQAAQAWRELAADLTTTALSYRTVLGGLAEAWRGPSAVTMSGATGPYVAWLETTAAQAAQVGAAAQAAAEAASMVRFAVVPPAVIAANRTALIHLIATNLLGQNSAAIAALEAQYAAMWAQDITAMSAYRSASSGAVSALPKFSPAPNTTSSSLAPVAAAVPAQLTPIDLINAILTALGLDGRSPLSLLTYALIGGLATLPIDILGLFASLFGPIAGSSMIAEQLRVQNALIAGKPSAPMTVYPPPAGAGSSPAGVPEVTVQTGAGGRIGSLRVPPSWARPPEQSRAAQPLPAPSQDREEVPIGLPVIPAVPVTGGKGGQKKGSKFEDMDYGRPVPPVLQRHPSGG